MKNSVYSFSKLLFLLVFLLAGSSIFASETFQKRDFSEFRSDSFRSAPSKSFLPEKLNEDSLLQKAEENSFSEYDLQSSISLKSYFSFLKKETSKAQISAISLKVLLSRHIFPFHFFW
ncbi:hypothetical protein E0K83_05470 [Gramella sp. BOM4]|nr:hypothetical protein [Christiangramia bathymodioli]